MKPMLLLAAALGAWPCAVAMAQDAATKADVAKGQAIVNQVCAACHGSDGNSPTPVNPSLAGQGADYIALQLAHFKAGIRTNPIMQGMAATLTPEDMKALGVYFSLQKPKPGAAKDAALVTAGQKLYRGGDLTTAVPACSACHSPAGAGLPKNYPRLAGQHAEYSYTQLKAFKAEERGADKGGKDVNGHIMVTIAGRMTDAQMRAAAEFISGLQ